MKIIYSPKCCQYLSSGHPESPERVRLIYEELKRNKQLEFVEPKLVGIEDLKLAHSQRLIEAVKNGSFYDVDTPNINNIFEYARLSVGGAILASEIAEKEKVAFSLMRPPGHHATKNSIGGFCYFNNIAISSLKLVNKGKKVGILDIDVHHGNGTEDIICGNRNIIFCSLHQVPLYPGTGLTSQENCFNFPIAPYSKFIIYRKALSKAIKKINDFRPNILGVSLGFDTYKADYLASLKLEIVDYIEIGRMIRQTGLPVFFVLEGGYSHGIEKCSSNFFGVFLDLRR